MRLTRFLPAAALLLASGCAPLGRMLPPMLLEQDERLARQVTITRDEWGVPHVHGETDASAAFGVAYAQAEDAYHELEDMHIHALGRAAHWFGEQHLAADLAAAAFEVERLSREEYEREPAQRQAVWTAYARGLNYYRRTRNVPVRAIPEWQPWMPFALLRAERIALLGGAMTLADMTLRDADTAAFQLPGRWHDDAGDVVDLTFAAAVSPARAAAGNALLLHARDHAFADHGRSYEVHVRSDEGWHVSGVALLGTPVPRAGRNQHFAWAHGGGMAADAAVVDVAPDQPADAFREWQDTVLVNTHEGVVQRVYSFRGTQDGPLVARRDGRPVAVGTAVITAGGALQQWYTMGRARGLAEFEAALAPAALPVNGTVYADTAGNILSVEAGAGPRRLLNPPGGVVLVGSAPGGAAHPIARLAGADSVRTLDAWAALVFDTHAPAAASEIQRLVLEWEQVGGSNPERAMRMDEALDLLRSWDRTAMLESVATTLYVLWQQRLRTQDYDGAFGRFRALEDVTARAPWGEVNRLQRPGAGATGFSDDRHSLPLAAVPWWTGGGSNFIPERGAGTSRRYGVRGYAWAGAVELAPVPVARSVAVFGQSADPASAHFFDQAALYAAGEMRSAWFERDDVAVNGRRVYRPGERTR